MNKKLSAVLAASILFCTNFASAEVEIDGASNAPATINHTDSTYYPNLDFYNMTSTDSLTILPNYPTYQQTTEYTCDPAAALTVLRYYDNNYYDEMKLAKEMKTQGYPIGTNPANMVKFFERIGWKVQSSLTSKPLKNYAEFKDFVLGNLRRGVPIMVENVEFGGNWRVIIGYDTMNNDTSLDDVLIFMDSYDTSDHKQDGYTFGSGRRFFAMWFDHSMLPENQRKQPWLTATPN